MSDRPLYAPEAEFGVVGALLIKPEMCEEVGAFLSSADFSDPDAAMLYNLTLSAHSKGVRPDPLTLSDLLGTLPSGDSTIARVTEISMSFSSAANVMPYARTIVERALARRLYSAGQMIIDLSCTRGSLAEQVSEAQQALFDLSVNEDVPDVQSYHQMLIPVLDEMDDRFNGRIELGLDFGLPDLDKVLKSIRPGNLVIIAGKPGTGKTVLGTNLADKIATKDGKAALIFSLEMPGAELVRRSLAAAGGVDKGWIDSGGTKSDEPWGALTMAVASLRDADVRICDKGALTFSRICNIARFQHRVKKLDVMVVDYLTLIRADKDERFGTRSQEIGSFTRGFKALAKELNIPIVVLAQLNRASESRSAAESKPRMSDLRDSGEIEQDADIVILGHRADDEGGRMGLTSWNVAKIRHSSPAECFLQFQGQYQRFVSATPQVIAEQYSSYEPRKSSKDFIR